MSSKNSTLDSTQTSQGGGSPVPPTSALIAARIIELTEIKRVIEKRITELQKASKGIENLVALSGKELDMKHSKLLELPWKPSKFPADNPKGEWIHFNEVPEWARNIKFPLTDGEYKYFKSKNGNLTRYKQ